MWIRRIWVRFVVVDDVDKGLRVRLVVFEDVDRGYGLGLLYSKMWIGVLRVWLKFFADVDKGDKELDFLYSLKWMGIMVRLVVFVDVDKW